MRPTSCLKRRGPRCAIPCGNQEASTPYIEYQTWEQLIVGLYDTIQGIRQYIESGKPRHRPQHNWLREARIPPGSIPEYLPASGIEKKMLKKDTWVVSSMSMTDHSKSFGKGYESCRTSSQGLEGSIKPSSSGGASSMPRSVSCIKHR